MEKNESIEIKRIWEIVKSRKLIIILILAVFIMCGYVYSYHYLVPNYKTTSTLLLIPNSTMQNIVTTNTDLTLNSELIYTYGNIAQQPKVLKKVIDNLQLDITEKELLESIEVNVIEDTYIIEMTVKNKNPEKAMLINKELSKVFLDEIKEIYNLENIGIVDEAEIPNNPYNINHIKDIIMFIALGIIVSFAVIFIFYVLDNTIKEEKDIEEYVKIKTLGRIPYTPDKENEIVNKTRNYVAECINTIRTNMLYMSTKKGSATVLITSCKPQDGKSWVSANIAASFAQTNKKVLLIDADMRKGRAGKILQVENTEGLSNYLYSMTGNFKEDIELAKRYIKGTKIPNLYILTNGIIPPNPSELLDSINMKNLLNLLKNIFDIIIVDAPPCKIVTDSVILSTIVDYTLLVVNSGKTKINDLQEAKKSIQIVGGNIIGAILNKIEVTGSVYKKNYYYGESDEEKLIEVKPKEFLSVEKIIDSVKDKIEDNGYNTFIQYNEENKEILENKNTANKDENYNIIKEIIKQQNEYIENMMKVLYDIKLQINQNRYNIDKNKNELLEIIANAVDLSQNEVFENLYDKIRASKDEIIEIIKYRIRLANDDMMEFFKENEEIVNDEIIERIKDKVILSNEEIIEKINIKNNDFVEKISNKISSIENEVVEIINNKITIPKENSDEEENLSNQEIVELIKDKVRASKDELVEVLNYRLKSAKEDIVQIINSKVETSSNTLREFMNSRVGISNNEIKDIVNKKSGISSEEIKELINSKIGISSEEIKKYINDKIEKSNGEIKEIINDKIGKSNTEIKELINKKVETTNNVITEYIDKKIKDLKKNIKIDKVINQKEKVSTENDKVKEKKIIDIKWLRRNYKRKRVYSIYEEIPSAELEKTAFCIVSIGDNDNKDENIVAIK